MKTSTVWKIVRLGISAGLIAFLLVKINVHEIASHLKGLALVPLVAAACMDMLMIAVQAWRWDVLLRARGIGIRFTRLVYYYLVSIFFSAFLPTSVGGDFARIVAVAGATRQRADAVASIVVERILGFFVLLPVSLAAIPLVSDQLKEWKLVLAAEIIGVAVVLGFLVLLVRPVARAFSRILDPLLKLFPRFRARERLERVYSSVVLYRGSRRALLEALALSVVSRVLWVFACYLIARAFPLPHSLGIAALFVVVPIIELVRMIPVSISGLGLREAAFAVMLKQFGVEYSLGVSFGIVVYVIFFVFALIGGVFYGLGSLRRTRAAEPTDVAP